MVNGESTFNHIHDTVHRGDIIGIVGTPCKPIIYRFNFAKAIVTARSKTGELSIVPQSVQVN